MNDKAFYTGSGRLTDYALSCGYVETKTNAGDDSARLWKEHNCYHITGFKLGNRYWLSSESLTEARKIYDNAI